MQHSIFPIKHRKVCLIVPVCACVPEHGHGVAGGPAHDEAPLRVGASFTHLLDAGRCPHLAHSNLGLHLEVGGRPSGHAGNVHQPTKCHVVMSQPEISARKVVLEDLSFFSSSVI